MEYQMKQVKYLALATPLALFGTSAFAALPEAVTTAISGAEADIATAGGLILAVIIGIKVFKWIQRVF